MSAQDINDLDGKLYVYRDEATHAASINRWYVGPNGGLGADTIATMRVSNRRISVQQMDAYAAKFAASEGLCSALEMALAMIGQPVDGVGTLHYEDIIPISFEVSGFHLKQMHAALENARGEQSRASLNRGEGG